MKSLKRLVAILAVLLLVAILSTSARCEWWLSDGDEEILLSRDDESSIGLFHQVNRGTYGYYDDTLAQFIVVVDFVGSYGISSYAYWKPGPLDWLY